jgi:hypothetical protein
MFTVLHPFRTTIDGDTYLEAIKNFVKVNHNLNLNDLIITDQKRYWKANINYKRHDSRNRIGINVTPLSDLMVPSYLRTGIVAPNIVTSPNTIVSRQGGPTIISNNGMGSPMMSPMGSPMMSPMGANMVSPMMSPMGSHMVSPMGSHMVSPMGARMVSPMMSPRIMSPNIFKDENGKEQRVVSNLQLSPTFFKIF